MRRTDAGTATGEWPACLRSSVCGGNVKVVTFVNQGILMHKIVKAAVAVGACVVLTGCPEVKRVQGSVYARTAGLYGPSWTLATVGYRPMVGAPMELSPGASITISVAGTDGKDCELTYTSDFIVTEPVDCRKQKEENEQKQSQEQQQQQEQQQSGQSQNQQGSSQQQASQGEGLGQGQPGTGQPGYTPSGGGGGGGGVGGPQVVATSVPTFTRIMEVVNNPILTSTLSMIGAAAVVKEVHDQTNGDGDKPISK